MVTGGVRDVRQELFAELTYHTAYDPMRGIRTARYKYIRSFADRPLHLPAHVDASPTKDLLRDRGYFEPRRPPELLFDLVHDPEERTNLADDPAYASVRDALRDRLERLDARDRRPAPERRGGRPGRRDAHPGRRVRARGLTRTLAPLLSAATG